MTNNRKNTKGLVACLGWGSLIWDPRTLPIQRYWFNDGPFVCAEFLRRSGNGRITLVLDESAQPVRSLWAVMNSSSPNEARMALCRREGIPAKREKDYVGLWTTDMEPPPTILGLDVWAESHNIEAVVWTALPQKFHEHDQTVRATSEDIVAYLASLTGSLRLEAEGYIRKAPAQIDTPIRRIIEAELGWTATSNWS